MIKAIYIFAFTAMGCRSFVASTTTKLLREVGIRGKTQQLAIKELSREDQSLAVA